MARFRRTAHFSAVRQVAVSHSDFSRLQQGLGAPQSLLRRALSHFSGATHIAVKTPTYPSPDPKAAASPPVHPLRNRKRQRGTLGWHKTLRRGTFQRISLGLKCFSVMGDSAVLRPCGRARTAGSPHEDSWSWRAIFKGDGCGRHLLGEDVENVFLFGRFLSLMRMRPIASFLCVQPPSPAAAPATQPPL